MLFRFLVLVVLEVEVLGEGPVDELGEEDLAAAVLVDRVELCKEQEVKWSCDILLEMAESDVHSRWI